MEKRWKIVLIIATVIVALLALYFTFFFTKKCGSETCFNSAMVRCSRASFVDDKADAIWHYRILGKGDGSCRIETTLILLKQGTMNMGGMERKSMICDIPLTVVIAPQSNLENCHGRLKEEMQKIMINKLFAYISSNLGEITEELEKVI